MDKCPICNEELPIQFDKKQDFYKYYNCSMCGLFGLSLDVFNTKGTPLFQEEKGSLNTLRTLAIIRKKIYLHNLYNNQHFSINLEMLNDIIATKFPTPVEQINNFILFLGDNTQNAGNTLSIDFAKAKEIKDIRINNKAKLFSYVPFINLDNYKCILEYSKEYINSKSGMGVDTLTLTLDGWEKYEELKRGQNNSHKAFMAMQYGNTKLDCVFTNIIKPGLKELGFEINRLDKTDKNGLIDENLRVEIRDSKFLVVDLSDGNNGAYWEAGYGEGLNKKIFYICDKQLFDTVKDLVHFDVSHQHLYFWNENNSENPNKFIDSLKAGIRLAFPEIK